MPLLHDTLPLHLIVWLHLLSPLPWNISLRLRLRLGLLLHLQAALLFLLKLLRGSLL